ncbi:hypothetical protein BD289DRAFT_117571 [Coniella lustricola]|uniref:Uncharacterized protein n=1 Tax=Coniella lustricola TaxID=2025994 RepID=A0A2T2ZWV9_9PEZI|nr:hypothetical protein BD289DRAFT_117571 [Coniella lustricola]
MHSLLQVWISVHIGPCKYSLRSSHMYAPSLVCTDVVAWGACEHARLPFFLFCDPDVHIYVGWRSQLGQFGNLLLAASVPLMLLLCSLFFSPLPFSLWLFFPAQCLTRPSLTFSSCSSGEQKTTCHRFITSCRLAERVVIPSWTNGSVSPATIPGRRRVFSALNRQSEALSPALLSRNQQSVGQSKRHLPQSRLGHTVCS